MNDITGKVKIVHVNDLYPRYEYEDWEKERENFEHILFEIKPIITAGKTRELPM